MRGPHIMAALCPQQFSGRAIDRDRVAGRFHAAEADVAVLIGEEFAAQVHIGLDRILILIKSFG